MDPDQHDHIVDLGSALDFVNTLELVRGEPTDRFQTTRQALDWLRERGLRHAETGSGGPAGDPAGRRTLARIRHIRAALRELADATVEGRPANVEAIDAVNGVLRAGEVIQLEPVEGGLRIGHRHVGDPVDDALARLAEPIVRAIVAGRPERVRRCANDGCRWVFYDDSRTGRRRWCDMSSCGNRAKAARHRARAKGAAAPGETVAGT